MLPAYVLAAMMAAAAGPAWQAARGVQRFQIDPSHSAAGFAVRHLGLSKVRGSFPDLRGSILYDEADPTRSSVTVIITTASLTTANERRDNDLKQNFFDVSRFPTLVFQSTRVTRSDEGLALDGMLSIRDVSRPVRLDVTALGERVDTASGERRLAFEGRLAIDRNDFGVRKDGHPAEINLVIGDRVEIDIQVEALQRSFAKVAFDSRQKPSMGEELSRVLGQAGLEAALRRYRELGGAQSGDHNVAARELGVLGLRLLERGEAQAAVRILTLATEAEPHNAAPHEWLGHAQVAAGDADGAIASYRRSLAIDPANTSAIEMVRRVRNQTDQATPDLTPKTQR